MRLQLILLVAVLASATTARGENETKVSSDVLLYTDTDQVMVASPQVGIRHALDEEGGEVSARVTLDAITAASVDVVSNATYRFSELRTEANASVSKSFDSLLPSLSYRFSDEPDYDSHGVNAGLGWDINGGDSSLSASYGITRDTVGRTGTPSSVFSETLTSHSSELGFTQVLDPNTLVRGVYSLTAQFGYMEKPYRSVPIFDANALDLLDEQGVTLDLQNFDDLRLAFKPDEEVPDDRYRHALALRGLRYVDRLGASLRLDYRLYGDSWGIIGHTVEGAFAKSFFDDLLVETWMRLHYQTGADFWRREYSVEDPMSIPSLRTTDKALSPYAQGTGGLRISWEHGSREAYGQIAAMYSHFLDHLFIDKRVALISQLGARWSF